LLLQGSVVAARGSRSVSTAGIVGAVCRRTESGPPGENDTSSWTTGAALDSARHRTSSCNFTSAMYSSKDTECSSTIALTLSSIVFLWEPRLGLAPRFASLQMRRLAIRRSRRATARRRVTGLLIRPFRKLESEVLQQTVQRRGQSFDKVFVLACVAVVSGFRASHMEQRV
jgi:hypothetical protein